MNLSWSHKLFLRINKKLGTHPVRDQFMIFSAKWLIVVMLAVVVLCGIVKWMGGDFQWMIQYFKLFTFVFVLGEAISYLFGFLFRHPRPRIEFPQSRQLINTVTTWKSFPSDHAIGSFALAGSLLFTAFTPVWLIVVLYLCAVAVSVARVYVGVHYPRDIIGGFVIAHMIFLFLPSLLYHIVEPFGYLW